VHMQEVVRALIRRGVDVDIVARRFGRDRLPGMDSAQIHRLPRPSRGRVADAEGRDLNAVLRDRLRDLGELDLVYERFSLGSFGAMEHARSAGVPRILEINGPRVEKAAVRGAVEDIAKAEEAASRAVSAATAVVAVSAGVAEHVRDKYGAGSKVHVVPNGVDPERFPAALFEARARAEHPFTVGFVGTFKPHHGLDDLVDAFARLRRGRPDTRLLLVGDGSQRTAVEASLRAHRVGDGARLTGAVAPERVGPLLAEMDVGVAPYPISRAYVSPLKVFEYMAAGLPVVCSGVEQITDLVEDGVTGMLFEPEDVDALARLLERLAGDPDLRVRLGSAGRARVMAGHTWDAVAQRVLEIASA
jgi:glycosyltransferase involved in cell wall biosynthesis